MTKFYTVRAVEKFLVRTVYYGVEASCREKAISKCQLGLVPYDEKEILEGDDEWVETIEVEEEDDDSN